MPRPNNFPAALRAAREKAGLSIAAAAARETARGRKVSPRTWAYWENGERLPPAERDAITRERLIASLTEAASPGDPNVRDDQRAASAEGKAKHGN